MKLIVGLGNPGEKYQNTRHNLGFRVVDELSAKCRVLASRRIGQSAKWEYKEKLKSEILSLIHNSNSFILAKPQTFMNNSGLAISAVAEYFKIRPEDIIIVHDDLDLPLGKIKVRLGGSGGGHHGMESIIKSLGTEQFIRVRLGIGNERSHSGEHQRVSFNADSFVLEKFDPKENPEVKSMIKQAVKALEILLEKGLEAAQNQFN